MNAHASFRRDAGNNRPEACATQNREYVAQRFLDERGKNFPLAPAVEHFADALANVAGAFGVGFQTAGCVGMFQRFFDAEKNWLGGEQALLHPHGFGERLALWSKWVGNHR